MGVSGLLKAGTESISCRRDATTGCSPSTSVRTEDAALTPEDVEDVCGLYGWKSLENRLRGICFSISAWAVVSEKSTKLHPGSVDIGRGPSGALKLDTCPPRGVCGAVAKEITDVR
jgi:hypothetical protein